jgi:IS30 family transposase
VRGAGHDDRCCHITLTGGDLIVAYSPLSAREREEISRALVLNPYTPWAIIARNLDRHPSTISREVARWRVA